MIASAHLSTLLYIRFPVCESVITLSSRRLRMEQEGAGFWRRVKGASVRTQSTELQYAVWLHSHGERVDGANKMYLVHLSLFLWMPPGHFFFKKKTLM